MITAIVILSLLVVALGYTTYNLLRKNEKQEDILAGYLNYLDKISRIIEVSDKRLKDIDARGTFKSDDEVGFFFERLKMLNEMLKPYNVKL